MSKIIVSDASPLIALAKLDHLELLFCSFSEIHIPNAVYLEVTSESQRTDAQRIGAFVTKHKAAQCFIHHDLKSAEYLIFKGRLDEGESQAMALASQLKCGVLIDERLGRSIAAQHSIPVVGIMGILLKAKESGAIERVKPLIAQLLIHKYRLSSKVINIVLNRAGEQ